MRLIKISSAAAGTVMFLFLLGFALFVGVVDGYVQQTGLKADAIVALTGGDSRIAEAVRLLSEGKANRLLISGVNRLTTRDELRRLSGLPSIMFDCCVDIGYAALDTTGNADETRSWAGARGYSSLIVVTSSYHMPRSLVEIGRVMPAARLIPYPVHIRNFQINAVWEHRASARLLVLEYLKFLPSAVRYGLARLSLAWDPRSSGPKRDIEASGGRLGPAVRG